MKVMPYLYKFTISARHRNLARNGWNCNFWS